MSFNLLFPFPRCKSDSFFYVIDYDVTTVLAWLSDIETHVQYVSSNLRWKSNYIRNWILSLGPPVWVHITNNTFISAIETLLWHINCKINTWQNYRPTLLNSSPVLPTLQCVQKYVWQLVQTYQVPLLVPHGIIKELIHRTFSALPQRRSLAASLFILLLRPQHLVFGRQQK